MAGPSRLVWYIVFSMIVLAALSAIGAPDVVIGGYALIAVIGFVMAARDLSAHARQYPASGLAAATSNPTAPRQERPMDSLEGLIVRVERHPHGPWARVTLDSGRRIYVHEADVRKLETSFGTATPPVRFRFEINAFWHHVQRITVVDELGDPRGNIGKPDSQEVRLTKRPGDDRKHVGKRQAGAARRIRSADRRDTERA